MGEIVAFVSQKSKNSRDNVIFYGELLYTCNEKISEFVFFKYLINWKNL